MTLEDDDDGDDDDRYQKTNMMGLRHQLVARLSLNDEEWTLHFLDLWLHRLATLLNSDHVDLSFFCCEQNQMFHLLLCTILEGYFYHRVMDRGEKMASDEEETEAEMRDYVDAEESYDLLGDVVTDATLMMAASESDDLNDEGGKQKVTVVDLMMYQHLGQ